MTISIDCGAIILEGILIDELKSHTLVVGVVLEMELNSLSPFILRITLRSNRSNVFGLKYSIDCCLILKRLNSPLRVKETSRTVSAKQMLKKSAVVIFAN